MSLVILWAELANCIGLQDSLIYNIVHEAAGKDDKNGSYVLTNVHFEHINYFR